MTGGNFLHFLRKLGINQTPYQLTKFSLDAALGMEYLTSQNCIHQYLAAKNCFVDDNYKTLKISDFFDSFIVNLFNECCWNPYCKLIPTKWTAPEVCVQLECMLVCLHVICVYCK